MGTVCVESDIGSNPKKSLHNFLFEIGFSCKPGALCSRKRKWRRLTQCKVAIGVVLAAQIFVCIALNSWLLDPADFSGEWYRTKDGSLYIFEKSVILCRILLFAVHTVMQITTQQIMW